MVSYDLSILNEQERAAFEMHRRGLTYRRIAEKLGITAAAARGLALTAHRRLLSHAMDPDGWTRTHVPVDFPVTRAELECMLHGLLLLEDHLLRQSAGADARRPDLNAYLAGKSTVVHGLVNRAQFTLYSEVRVRSRLSDDDSTP